MLVLASNSPRRKQLLALGGWKFQISPVEIDENPKPGETPRDYVLRLARKKAVASGLYSPPGSVVVAADTAVVDGKEILGKPANTDEARLILQRLRGRTHQVYTGVAVLDMVPSIEYTDLCITNVLMREFSDAEISSYLASGDPLDKAGAYAIQNRMFNPVERIEGCYANVMGLPMCHLSRTFINLDVRPHLDILRGCQDSLQNSCSISEMVLRNEI